MRDRFRFTAGKVYLGAPGSEWQPIGDGVEFDLTPDLSQGDEPFLTRQQEPFTLAARIAMNAELTEHFTRLNERLVRAAREAEEAVFAEALEKGWGVLQVGFWEMDPHRDPDDHVYRGGVRSLATPLIAAGRRVYFRDIATARRALGLDEEGLPDGPA